MDWNVLDYYEGRSMDDGEGGGDDCRGCSHLEECKAGKYRGDLAPCEEITECWNPIILSMMEGVK